jgi:hypothetical protein
VICNSACTVHEGKQHVTSGQQRSTQSQGSTLAVDGRRALPVAFPSCHRRSQTSTYNHKKHHLSRLPHHIALNGFRMSGHPCQYSQYRPEQHVRFLIRDTWLYSRVLDNYGRAGVVLENYGRSVCYRAFGGHFRSWANFTEVAGVECSAAQAIAHTETVRWMKRGTGRHVWCVCAYALLKQVMCCCSCCLWATERAQSATAAPALQNNIRYCFEAKRRFYSRGGSLCCELSRPSACSL